MHCEGCLVDVTIAIDAMGGDHGTSVTVPAALEYLRKYPNDTIVLVGLADEIETVLRAFKVSTGANLRVQAASEVVGMDESPQAAMRNKKDSSMRVAINLVKDGTAHACISAGNTGALMAMALFCLRGENNIDRPAIAGVWPTLKGDAVVLDIGATIGADAEQLFEYAVMGAAMARALFDKERPTVGLLNIGVEEVKGLEEIRLAGQMLKEADLPYLDYAGFVEGDDIGKGTTDVVVTEGFTGNIALKSAEGTATQFAAYLREAMKATFLSRVGYFLARNAFKRLRAKIDPRQKNGGAFLGLGGLVIKSHGGTDAEGFASAIEIGYSMAKSGIVEKINHDLSAHRQAVAASDKVANTGAM